MPLDRIRPALMHGLDSAIDKFTAKNPQSAAALERARAVLPGGNTRSSLWSAPFPLCIASGEGCRIRDVDGNTYVDFLGEFTAGIFGHSSPILARALADAHARGINLSSHTPYEVELAERLVARFPSMDRVRFANSGTEATIMAITAARLTTGRERIIAFEGGYHGGVATFIPGADRVNAPYQFDVLPFDDLTAVQAAFAHDPQIAAVLVEPMQGAGGCRVASTAFLAGLRSLCDSHGAVLIFDEVQTARMAEGGMQARLGITPDMTTVGKFFGGGLAFGAFGGRASIMDRFDPARPDALAHAGTFNNNSLTMATGVAAIDHYLTPAALEALFERGETFRGRLNAAFGASGLPFEATGLGSIMNIHARLETADSSAALRRLLQFGMMAKGQYFAARGLIALSLAIGDAEIEGFFTALTEVLADIAGIMAEDAA
ncbi:aspartate aminotransferase family protein [Pararhodobacter zhoushanensis]|uniref:Aminotransferase class III-fold pyridoxal phosphate-dependent enzyme n=1 Tax=Pararhodobacter zhoushanensis TaxID=2479545 RepID=A0ABT3H5D5_9RHOB|nr:aminotransferase class III-fold pyridoxal phosphate-dependent enzyme [Pararhodobacter zhoushanensis]MCW1935017.1 aminotransferase class III-fold pyridoxal phosphate-dependent enzyme [Pararhodobacter zhoushanensis]